MTHHSDFILTHISVRKKNNFKSSLFWIPFFYLSYSLFLNVFRHMAQLYSRSVQLEGNTYALDDTRRSLDELNGNGWGLFLIGQSGELISNIQWTKMKILCWKTFLFYYRSHLLFYFFIKIFIFLFSKIYIMSKVKELLSVFT